MNRLRQIAVAVVGGLTLSFGVVGCMQDRPDSISPNAMLQTSGNQTLNWTASSAGNVTVFDQNTDKIVYGSKVTRGQALNVDVDKNQIMLDNELVSQNNLHRGDQYRVFFEPTTITHVEEHSTVETNTVETTHNK